MGDLDELVDQLDKRAWMDGDTLLCDAVTAIGLLRAALQDCQEMLFDDHD